MKYFLIVTHADGTKEQFPVDAEGLKYLVMPGDDVRLVDEFGRPVNADLQPSGANLKLIFDQEHQVTLENFYGYAEDADPILVTLNPEEFRDADYEFNAQVGNLPGLSDFTLMRFSNTGYIDFEEQFDSLTDVPIPPQSVSPSGIGGGGGNEEETSPPNAADDFGATQEQTAVTIDLLDNDTDPDGDPLTLTNINGEAATNGQPITLPSGAVVTPVGNGQIEYDPGNNFEFVDEGETAIDTFEYTITDSNGETARATVSIAVSGVDQPTVVNPDEGSVNEGETVCIDVLANDSDPDTSDNPIAVNSVEANPVGGGSVTTDGSKVFFDPESDFDYLDEGETAVVTFSYVAETPDGDTVTDTVTVTVNGIDTPSDTNPDEATTTEEDSITVDVLINDSDPDASDNPLVVDGVSQPVAGTVIDNGTDVVFDPGTDFQSLAAGETATVSFTYNARTPDGDVTVETVTVTVTGENDAPDALDDADSTNQNESIAVDVLANDSDPDTSDALTITGVTQPGSGTVTNSAGDVTFDPSGDFDYLDSGETATVSFTYDIADGNGQSDTATVSITVNGTDDPTVARPDSDTVDEDATVTVAALANDSDPDTSDNPLTVDSVNQPALGSVLNNGTDVSFDPGTDFQDLDQGETATVTFTYGVGTPDGDTAVETVTITVTGSDDPADTNPDDALTSEDATVSIDVLANDSDPDTSDNPLTVDSVTQPGLGTVVNNGTDVNFDPGTDFNYLDDGETATVSFTYNAATPDGDTVIETVTVTVNGVDDPTETNPDDATTTEDTPVVIDVLDNDSDPDTTDNPLTVTGVSQPGGGSVINNGTDVTFDPGTDFQDLGVGETSTVTFTYSVETPDGDTVVETVTVTVNGQNDVPDAIDDSASTTENATVTVANLVNDSDPDSDPLTVTAVTQPGSGTASHSGTNVTFDPGTDFEGLAVGETATVTFTYDISDGNGGSDTATVTITVNGENDVPDAIDDSANTTENATITVANLTNDSDPDSDPLTVTSITQPGSGTASFTGTSVTFDPGTDFEGLAVGETATVTFTYDITDGNGGSDTATVTVTINGENDTPDAIDDSANTTENATVTVANLTNDSDPDSDPLTVTSITQPGSGTASFTGTSVTFDPGTDFEGLAVGDTATVTFTYDITDGNGGSDTATVTVTISGENDAPDAINDSASTSEDAPVLVANLVNDSDPDSDPLTVTNITQPGAGASSHTGTDVTFDPGTEFQYLDSGETATTTFTYDISDGNGGTDTATVTITVNGSDDPAETNPDSDTTTEDATVVVDVLANDSDPDTSDNPLTVGGITQPTQGTVINNGTNVTFDPGTDFQDLAVGETATVTFTYNATTPDGDSVVETVTVTVNGLNDTPDAVDDSANTTENATVTVANLTNDSDPDSDPLTVTSITQPGSGAASFTGTSVTFDPGTDFEGLAVGETATVTFTYDITDGSGGSDTATVTVTINGENDTPDAIDDSTSTTENATVTVANLTNDSDPDSDPLTVTSITQPGSGAASFTGTSVTFDPGTDFEGLAVGETATVTFTYDITDGNGGSDTATVTVTINGENDTPDAIDDSTSTTEDATVTVANLTNDSDPDSDPLTVTSITQPGSGAATFTGTSVTFDPGTDFQFLDQGETATVTFTYDITDGNGGTDTATVTVTVNGSDDPLVTDPDTAVTSENATVTVDVLANDSDPDMTDNPLTVTGVTQPGGGTVINNGTNVTFDPGTDFEGLAVGESATVTFTYEVTNTDGATAVETATVTINGANDALDAVDDSASTTENATVTVATLTNDSDPDNDPLTVTGVTQPGSGTASHTGTNVTFDPGTDFEGLAVGETATVTFTYDIADGNGGTDTATVTVTINGENDTPDAIDDSTSTTENATVTVANLTNDSDPDSDPLTVTSITQPGSGSASFTGTSVTFDPGTDFEGLAVGETATVTFTYDITDGNGGSDTATVTVTINGENDTPDAIDDSANTTENATVTVANLTNDSDPDSDPLTVTSITQPGSGTASFTGTSVTFDPGTDFEGLAVGDTATVTFTYDISDGNGGSDTATVTVTISGENDTPNAIDDSASTSEDAPVLVANLVNDSDPDSDPLTVTNITQPGAGAASHTGTDVTFDPGTEFQYLDSGETATTTFTYDISDGNGGTDTATVTITVNGSDDPAVTNPDSDTTTEDATVVVDVLANDSDPDTSDNPLTVGGITQPTQGTVINNGTNVTFDPGTDFQDLAVGDNETVTFTYNATTPDGDSVTETVTITVIGTNDGPQAVNDANSTDELVPVNIDVVANDFDGDTGDTLSIQRIEGNSPVVNTPIALASGATVTLLADGTVDYTPAASTNALDDGETALDSFTYVVQDQNGVTDTATVSVTINGLDDPIVALNDGAVVDQNDTVTVDVLLNDHDPDTTDEPLTVTVVNAPAEGTVTDNGDGTVTFNPNGDFVDLNIGESRATTFTYEVTNSDGDTGIATVNIVVNGENDAPIAVDDAESTTEGVSIGFDVRDNDTELDAGDQINVIQVNGGNVSVGNPVMLAGGGQLILQGDGSFSYQPAATTNALDTGETATDTFDYLIQDQFGGTATATATITILGADDPMTSNPDAGTVDEDSTVTVDVLFNDNDPDTSDNPLVVSAVAQPSAGQGTVVNNGTNITFDPGADFQDLGTGESEAVTFTYVVENVAGETLTETVNIIVTGSNDAVVAVDDMTSTTENATVTVANLTNDSDPESDPITVTGVTQPGSGAAAFTATNVTFDPGTDFDNLAVGETATVTFTYDVTDGNGGTDTATVTVTINGENDTPDAIDDSTNTTENATVTVANLTNDSDPDSDPLTVTSITQPGSGTASFTGTSVTFDPGTDFEGLAVGETATVTFTYDITDGNGGNDTAIVTVTINGENDTPDAIDDSTSTSEDATVVVENLVNDSDPDSDPLTITAITQPGAGTASHSGTDVTFDPGTDFQYLDDGETAITSFTYDISDGNGGSDTATVTVTVSGSDDPLVTTSDTAVTNESSSVTVDVLANDSDPDTSDNPLTVTNVTQPGSGSVINNGTDVTFDPGTDFTGLAGGETATVTFTYEVTNGDGSTAVETATVTITGDNDAPDAIDDSTSTTENATVTVATLTNDSDPDSDPLTVTAITQPGSGAASFTGTSVTFDPGTDFEGLAVGETATVTFTYDITDGNGGSDTATVTVTINGENDTPDAIDDSTSTSENATVTVANLTNDSDPDSDPLTVTSITQPGSGAASFTGTSVTFDPGTDFEGLAVGETATVTFTYDITDGNGGSDTATVTVTVNGENDTPDAIDDSTSTTENATVTVANLTNDSDPDSDPLTVTSITQPGSGAASFTGTSVTFDPGTDFEGLAVGETATVTFTYDISDGNGGSDTATVTVTINGENDTPDAIDDSTSTTEDATVTVANLTNDSDPDSDPLTVTSITQPGSGAATFTGTSVTFDPGTDFQFLDQGETATVTFTYDITDGNGGTDTATVTVTVNGSDDPLMTDPDTAVTSENATVTVDVLANDSDPDTTDNPLTVTGVTQPGGGTVINNGTNVTFDPGTDFEGLAVGESATVTFTYEVTNTDGATAVETATVTINGQDDPIATAPDSASTTENATVTIDVLTNDSDPDTSDNPLTLSAIATQPANGTVTISGNQAVFDPGTDFEALNDGETALETFVYTVSNADGSTVNETVTVTINGETDLSPPDAIDDTYVIDEGETLTATIANDILENDSDPDGDPLTVNTSPVTDVSNGTLVLNADGTFTYTPDDGFNGTDSFVYEISDGNGGTDIATATIRIDNDRDGYDNATDLDDDNDGILDTDECLMPMDSGVDGLITQNVTFGITSADPTNDDVSHTLDTITIDGTTYSDFIMPSSITTSYSVASNGGVNEILDGANSSFNYSDPDFDSKILASFQSRNLNHYQRLDGNNYSDGDFYTLSYDTPVLSTKGVFIAVTERGGNNAVVVEALDENGMVIGSAFTVPANSAGYLDTGHDVNPSAQIQNANLGLFAIDDIAPIGTSVHGLRISFSTTNTSDGPDGKVFIFGDAAAAFADCDPDGDGIPNHLDRDSDGGGIDDVIEVGGTDVDGDGQWDGPVDANGVPIGAAGGVPVNNGGGDPYDPVDDGLRASDDMAVTDEDSTVTVDVIANDSDPESDPLTVTSVTQPGNGTVSISGPEVVFDPGGDFESLAVGATATETFTYDISDGNGSTDTATVTVTINGQNDGPDAVDDGFVGTEDVPLTLTNADLVDPNDTDVDGDALTIVGVDTPINGTVALNGDGSVTFTPNSDYSGLAFFNYTISDGNGGTDTATVSMNFAPVNDPPDAVDDTGFIVIEDVPNSVNVLANDSDPENDLLTILGTPTALNGTVSVNPDQTLLYTPNSDYNGPDTITYTITDPSGGTDTATVAVNVISINDAPEMSAVNVSVAEKSDDATDSVIAGDLSGSTTDAEGDSLSFSTSDTGSFGTLNLNSDGSYTYNLNNANPTVNAIDAGETLVETFDITVDDGNGGTDTETLSIQIDGADDSIATVADSASLTPTVSTGQTGSWGASGTNASSTSGGTTVSLSVANGANTSMSYTPNGSFNSGPDAASNAAFWSNSGLTGDTSLQMRFGWDTTPETGTNQASDDGGTALVTITFSNAVVDPIIHIDRLGGSASNGTTTFSNGAEWTLTNAGATITRLSGNDQFEVDGNRFFRSIEDLGGGSHTNEVNNTTGTAGGSIQIAGSYTSLTFSVTGIGVEGTGGDAIEMIFETNTTSYSSQTVNVVGNDSDPDTTDNPLTVIGVSNPTVGTASTDGTNVTYNPGTGYNSALGFGETATETLTYTVQNQDGVTSTETVTFTIKGQGVPPVVIDLDGDGAEFDSVDEGIEFDVDGDGELEKTAWADEDDAVLIYDKNGNNDVDDRSEFAFADYSENPDATDLEGLAEAFDSNGDGILSAEDDDWGDFKLWQDKDGDGKVGEGEMISLDEAGIESIGLVSDGESYDAADGDVRVHGESEVKYSDGSTGIAADAEFAFEDILDSADDSEDLEIISNSGEVINLDESSGLDQAPGSAHGGAFDDLPEAADTGGTPDDDAAQAAAETGM